MGDLGNILLAVCGVVALCTCSLGLIFILALRVLGRSALMAFMPLLISFMNNRGLRNDDDDDVITPRAQSRGRPSADSLRSRAQSLDFDSRDQDSYSAQSGTLPPPPSDLSRNRFGGQGANQPPSGSRPLPGRPLDDNPLGPVDVPSLRGRSRGISPDEPPRRARRGSNANDDEVFGGMLDDDGDGHPDF